MPTAKVLTREIWWAGRAYRQGEQVNYDMRDLSEMKVRHELGDVQMDEAEARLPKTSARLWMPEPK